MIVAVTSRPGEQLVEARREEIRAAIALQLLAELRIDVAEADPADARIVARQHRADAADRAAADDREPDLLPLAPHSAASTRALIGVALSGSETGSCRSAERSAAT